MGASFHGTQRNLAVLSVGRASRRSRRFSRRRPPRRLRTGFLLLTSVAFWPLYLPLLLSARTARDTAPQRTRSPNRTRWPRPSRRSSWSSTRRSRASEAGRKMPWLARRIALRNSPCVAAQATRIREMDDLLSRTATTQSEAVGRTAGRGPARPGCARPLAEEPARAGPKPLSAGPRAASGIRRPHGDVGVDQGTRVDDPCGQVYRNAGIASRGTCGPDCRRRRRCLRGGVARTRTNDSVPGPAAAGMRPLPATDVQRRFTITLLNRRYDHGHLSTDNGHFGGQCQRLD